MSKKKIMGWHFVNNNRTLEHDAQNVTVEPGYVYTYDSDLMPRLCVRGMHGSRRAIDALKYTPGPIICRVALWGDVEMGNDKLVARNREVLWMADATRELRLWVCWCVRQVWHMLHDERSRHAVEVAERYAMGDATDEELAAAKAYARDVSLSSNWGAVERAAWGTTTGTPWVYAWYAAWDVARGVARGDAWVAAWDKQAQELERRMLALEGR